MDEGMRAEAIHHYLTRLRQYTLKYPAWNVAINLNGPLWGGVEVKVWHGSEVVFVAADRDSWLATMLEDACGYMEARLGLLIVRKPLNRGAFQSAEDLRNSYWLDFGYCRTCKVAMGRACVDVFNGEVRTEAHVGRARFSKEHDRQRG